MSTIVSPAEVLGLAGAALDSRVQRATQHLSDRTLQRIAERLRGDAEAAGVIYERDGQRQGVRILLRPLLMLREQMSYIHQVCLRLLDHLKQLPALYLQDAEVQRILRISDAESTWLRSIWTPRHGHDSPIYGRLDAVCDFASPGWQDSLAFMEANLSSVGGIHFAPVAEQLLMRDLMPSLRVHDPELRVDLLRDQRELFAQVLIDHARTLGRPECQICIIEPKYENEGPDESAAICQFLRERFGLTVSDADPRELRTVGDEVYHDDMRVDVAYRCYELRDLLSIEQQEGRELTAIRLLFRQNRVVSSVVGDFDHKSCLEILSEPQLAERFFPADELRLFERHVLWTRLVADRRCSLPGQRVGDLLEYARRNRGQLVLKPNRDYGGHGVTIGALTEQSAWETLLDQAAQLADDPQRAWVVQAATRLPVCEFPVCAPDGRVFSEPFYTVMGFAATENGLGVLCRAAQKQVVNVAQNGGLAAVLLADPPRDLRIFSRSQERAQGAYPALRKELRELLHLERAASLLEWDEETMLPVAGRAERGEQIATLEAIRHQRLTADRLGDLIAECAPQADQIDGLARELDLLREKRRLALALPEDLVRHYATAKSSAFAAWEDARQQNDYAGFAPAFATLLQLVRERASAFAQSGERYDALLDEFEPGMTRARIEPLFAELRHTLPTLVAHAAEQTAEASRLLAGRRFDVAAQWQLTRYILSAIGFDFARGRLDATTHPFTLLAGPSDVRLTSRVDEDNLWAAVLTALHEGGHGLYDQGFAAADHGRLLAEAASTAMHEAQARLWENHVGRSPAFCAFLWPQLQALFPTALAGLGLPELSRAINAVRPGVNRVSADELSYHLHILLRYELELALISGQLSPADLPSAWNERSQALLGVTPATPREGVLQDVHWAVGLFGYFPTYTLGSLYAAQLMATYRRSRDVESELLAGDFAGLLRFLRQHIHERGSRVPAEQLMREATGESPSTAAFFAHIQERHPR